MKKYIVLKEFADKYDLQRRFKAGDYLPEDFDAERIEKVVSLGLAEAEKEEITDIDLTKQADVIIAQVAEFSDYEKLKKYLDTETGAKNPRTTVVSAIEARLNSLTPAL